MKRISLLVIIVAFVTFSCGQSERKNNESINSTKVEALEELIAIDILLDPDSTMLGISEKYNKQLRQNYPEGFELDESHRPHITVIQAFVKKSNLERIESDLKKLTNSPSLANKELIADGLYFIPYEDKGLAGITVEKTELLRFHNDVIDLMESYTVTNGNGSAFVQRPDGEPIMDATVEYVKTFKENSSGAKYNPHVTIGTAYRDFVENLIEDEFKRFTFQVSSVSIYQLGELGTAQKKITTIKL